MARRAKNDPNVYPKGWDAARVKAVIDHYDNQTEEEAIAEAEAAYTNSRVTLMQVPVEMADTFRAMIAERSRRSAKSAGPKKKTRRKTA